MRDVCFSHDVKKMELINNYRIRAILLHYPPPSKQQEKLYIKPQEKKLFSWLRFDGAEGGTCVKMQWMQCADFTC